ncbi:MAG: UDP-N-acetylmuramoyl-L-alanyl-D-glutamate--2,6-diaminopimelate ligase [Proteobacteria bacterium]|nr:UDP-N-acetylmuramoyl-L-alanyl-D-glutamate--2,6-diaminopimelate ligase [Pseudomonadota bacterium]
MRLCELIEGVEVLGSSGRLGVEVRDLACDAGMVGPGSCFFALRGARRDGHDFVAEAVSRGAAAVVSERPIEAGAAAANVQVRNSRRALGLMSSRMLGEPSRAMTIVGVTGTNGKTTTTYLLESIFSAAGRRPGVIGTVEYRFAGSREPAPHTTPLGLDLQRLLARMRDAGCDSCAMEVSSHALEQERVAGCAFDAGVFTNLTPEHLDYHVGMDAYFAAKALLFERVLAEGGKGRAFAAINSDAEHGPRMAACSSVPVLLYGLGDRADVRGSCLNLSASGISMRISTPSGAIDCASPLRGSFNAQNILAAAAAAIGLGMAPEAIARGIAGVAAVPGRFEPVENSLGVLALVDYAHTPDALKNALSHAGEIARESGGRLIAVFGCGGDRDRKKRPDMGAVAAELADVTIVTSDNPRTEDPRAIIAEIVPGVERAMKRRGDGGVYEVITDRREAIGAAVRMAAAKDVIVVAGKGHEDYQIVGTARHRFDDREELARSFAERKARG